MKTPAFKDRLPSFANERIATFLMSIIHDLERSKDLRSLDLHFHRALAYIRAVEHLDGAAADSIQHARSLLDEAYEFEFRRIGKLGLLYCMPCALLRNCTGVPWYCFF